MTDTTMGLREFGRHVGLSGEGVRKAIKTGRIPPAALGEVTLTTGKTRPAIINVALAVSALGKNTDQNQQRDKRVLSENRRAVSMGHEKPHPRGGGTAAPAAEAPDPGMRAGQQLPTITESNQKIAAAKAQMALLELNEKRAKLVDADQVTAKFTNLITAARNKILGVPSEAKQRMPHMTMDDIEVLEDLLAEALAEVADGR